MCGLFPQFYETHIFFRFGKESRYVAEMEDEIWSLKQQISNMKAQYENNEQNLLNQVWRKAGFHFQIKIDISMETIHESSGAREPCPFLEMENSTRLFSYFSANSDGLESNAIAHNTSCHPWSYVLSIICREPQPIFCQPFKSLAQDISRDTSLAILIL